MVVVDTVQDGEILEETIMAMAVEDMIKDMIIKVIVVMGEVTMVVMIIKEDMDTIIMVDMMEKDMAAILIKADMVMIIMVDGPKQGLEGNHDNEFGPKHFEQGNFDKPIGDGPKAGTDGNHDGDIGPKPKDIKN